MSPNVDTHENTSASTNRKTMSEDNKKSIIISITTARVTTIHETANTKAALQAILVQILTVASKRVFCRIQIQYESLNQYSCTFKIVFIFIKH